jgi:hypothetical protein
MRAKFNQAFKLQAVEKALSRGKGISLAEAAALLILQKKPTICGDTTRTTHSDVVTAENDASD